ncbi:hypothetical protein [Pararhizobium antarcticum]|uniref:Uncharacterized protein n=1 Tax=Pararhizobium antarcticum TaxID=1798805 RepID=A0A657LWG5_9HYPH|nr:hypothetical protein [Pararhizobium antarcticum]OJF91034.1 hypothetical protein AX761_06110 [Rhizobium sp. 58]OJF99964.1 hypothetical protein AX760_11285 [Pararhizobium antarcticum]
MASTEKKTYFGVDRRTQEIVLGKFRFRLPQSRMFRVLIGCALILGGLLGFLPVLGFWMVPLGLIVLSQDFAVVRRLRRRIAVWWARKWNTS